MHLNNLNTQENMADIVTGIAASGIIMAFTVLFLFIRHLGILEMEAAMIPQAQRQNPEPQPMVEVKNPFKMTVSRSLTPGKIA